MLQFMYAVRYVSVTIWKTETEFRGQRILQFVVTKGHNICKVTDVPFSAGASVAQHLLCNIIRSNQGECLIVNLYLNQGWDIN